MKNFNLFKRAIGDLYRMGKKYYLLYAIQSFAQMSAPFIGYIYMTRIVDSLTQRDLSNITSLIIQYLLILLLLQLVGGYLQPYVDQEQTFLNRKIISAPNRKLLSMHYHYAESSEVREQLARINRNMSSALSSILMIDIRIRDMIPSLISVIWSLALLIPLLQVNFTEVTSEYWWMHPIIVSIVFCALVFFNVKFQIHSTQKGSTEMGKVQEDLKEQNAKFFYEYGILEDMKSGKEVRLYDVVEKLIENKESDEKLSIKMIEEVYRTMSTSMGVTRAGFQIMNFLIYGYIGILVLLGLMPLALIIQLSNALSQLVTAVPNLIQYTILMVTTPEVLIDYYEFMDLPDEEMIGSLPVEKRLDNQYHFSVEDLSFAYPESDELVLKNLSETFEVGKKYSIVGENGSGKTTFIKLLTRLYEPTKGSIKMNKIDSRKYDLKEYFNLFGVVFQDFHLVGFAIGQNVSVEPGYDKEKVLTTLEKVGLEDFIQTLPKQLDTYLGTEFDDSGVNVSGGQEQKIAIARSLYKDAPIMILDEPTAALDPVTEFEIYQNFDNMVEDKTAFYISHRLSSSKFCDEILVFDKGEIIQRGTHKELVKEEGKYQELWNAQAQYYQ